MDAVLEASPSLSTSAGSCALDMSGVWTGTADVCSFDSGILVKNASSAHGTIGIQEDIVPIKVRQFETVM